MTLLHILIYIPAAVFVIAVVTRAVRIAKMPIHLRWELYPVPHEKGRAQYGGSRLEEVDWWTKPHQVDHIGELFVMIQEILFLKGVWEHNRKLWFGSFPLHFGLYLLMGNMVLLVLAGVLQVAGLNPGVCGLLYALLTIIPLLTWIGCTLGIIGALVLLYMRLFDEKLSSFSTTSHYFNLLILGAIYVSGILWVIGDSGFAKHLSGVYAGLIAPTMMPATTDIPIVGLWHIGFSLFFIFYLPFTHMTHFFTKYFTYHAVRWEDQPNIPGSKMNKKLRAQLEQTVTWAAPHVGADGKKNWGDIATSPVPKNDNDKGKK